MELIGMNLFDEMRSSQATILERTGEALATAKAYYDTALANARDEAGLTKDPTCVKCTRCGAGIGKPCITNATKRQALHKPTTPHSPRGYAYRDLVQSVHRNDMVAAAKSRLDELEAEVRAADYETGRDTEDVRFMRTSVLYVSQEESQTLHDGYFVGYRPLYYTNMLGLRSDTKFSVAEVNFMLAVGVNVHILSPGIFPLILAALQPRREAAQPQVELELIEDPRGTSPKKTVNLLAAGVALRRRTEIAEFAQLIRRHRMAVPAQDPVPIVDEELLDAIMELLYGDG
jgi:hypothetical protein